MKKLKDSEISLIMDFTGIPVSIPLQALFTFFSSGDISTEAVVFCNWFPVGNMADIGSLFYNKVLQKQSAQKNESLEWLDFVCSISDFCWIFCTCHYGFDKTFWLN